MHRKWLLLFLFWFPLLSWGQSEVLHFNQLTVEDNLSSQNYNWYIYKDHQGFVWISSISGLNRYDGSEIRQYTPDPRDSLSLLDPNIQSQFFEDKKGNLWFSTAEGIQSYDRQNNNFKAYQLKGVDEALKENLHLLFFDTGKEAMWLRLNLNKLFVFDAKATDDPLFIGTFNLNQKSRIVKSKNPNEYWIFSIDSLEMSIYTIQFQEESREYVLRDEKKLEDINALSFYYDQQKFLWIGCQEGLVRLSRNDRTFSDLEKIGGVNLKNITAIGPYSGEELILGTEKDGLFIFNEKSPTKTNQIFTNKDGLVAPFLFSVQGIYRDQDEVLWLSVNEKGVFFTNPKKKKFKSFHQNTPGNSTEVNSVKSMVQDEEGNLWCLTQNGIRVLDKNGNILSKFSKFEWSDSISEIVDPFHILCDKSNTIWISSYSGLFYLTSPEKKFRKVFSSKPGMITFSTQLNNGNILASSLHSGVQRVNRKNEDYSFEPVIDQGRITEPYTWIYENSQGLVYICQNVSRIVLCKQQKNELIPVTSIPFEPMVNGIWEDTASQIVWLATANGLYKSRFINGLDSLEILPIDQLPNKTINGLLEDENGRLWMSSNKGLLSYEPENTNTIRTYSIADGLQSTEFNFWSCIKTREGKFAFGGVNGLNLFDPLKVTDITAQAKPKITDVTVNDMPPVHPLVCEESGATHIPQIQKLVFPFQENTLSFRFAALEYSDPSTNQFRFKMENYDDTLVYNGTRNSIRYPKLPAGHYIFKVWATNSDGAWSNSPAEIKIIIQPPWYKRWWANLLFLLTVLGIVYTIYRVRIDQIRKTEAIKRKEAEFKQLEAETKAAVLRLQMDPHFIGNCVNSIGAQILNNDPDTAYDYVSRLHTMMRLILHLGKEEFIYVSDEIDLLEAYLKVQETREACMFDYAFEIPDNLDPDEYKIPTMILQPFVENAIEHGMKHKKERSQLTIRFWLEGKSLNCSITDNGVGRAAASTINRQAEEHASKSMEITQRRLNLIQPVNGVIASVDITDLFDDSNAPVGTKVHLVFPFFN